MEDVMVDAPRLTSETTGTGRYREELASWGALYVTFSVAVTVVAVGSLLYVLTKDDPSTPTRSSIRSERPWSFP